MYTVIVANAPHFDATPFASLITTADCVIAADGGGNALFTAGLLPHYVVGDLDSLREEALAHFHAANVEIRRYAPNKDETDLELALLLACDNGAHRIDIFGAMEGRWDHSLSNVTLLTMPALIGRDVRLLDGKQELYLVRDTATVNGNSGDVVSLIPIGGTATGISLKGFQYPLLNANLFIERSRGISNVLLNPPGEVFVDTGMVLVVHHVSL